MEDLFDRDYGVIMALDMYEKDELRFVVDVCNNTPGVVALKVGSIPALHGLPHIIPWLRERTDLPFIYDGQKLGIMPPFPKDPQLRASFEDMFHMDGIQRGDFYGKLLGKLGVEAGIVYPLGGSRVQRSFTHRFKDNGVVPILMGRATWNGDLEGEGGLLPFPTDTPKKIYRRAAHAGVSHYIMPANRPDEVRRFVNPIINDLGDDDITPRICMPGYGTQGGTIGDAFEATQGLPSYAIIGPADCFDLSDRPGVEEHVKRYCGETQEFELGLVA
jgi:orotidine-5'-phosphate decarboxylase